jgi:hypothetical protein
MGMLFGGDLGRHPEDYDENDSLSGKGFGANLKLNHEE